MFNHLKRRIPKNEEFVRRMKYDKATKEDLIHEVKRQSNMFMMYAAFLIILLFASLLAFGFTIDDLGNTYLRELDDITIKISERLCIESEGELVRYYYNSYGELAILCEMEEEYNTFLIGGD